MVNRFWGIFLAGAILVCAWIYKDAWSSYFFQDDWFSLRISKVDSFWDIALLFLPRQDVIYFRPLGMQIPFLLLQTLFGVNPLPFRLLTFLTHTVNVFLVYLLVYLLFGSRKKALLVAFFFATSTVHYIPFFWSATYAFVLGPTFFFLSFICILLFIRGKNKKFLFLALNGYVVGLLVNEMVITLPPIAAAYFLLFGKRQYLTYLLPMIFIAFCYVAIRFTLFPVATSADYQIGFGKQVINNLEGYLLWSFNLPEELKAQLVNFYTLNPLFWRDFSSYAAIFVTTLTTNIVLFLIVPFAFLQIKKVNCRLLLFSAGWFFLGLIPVLFFPKHSFSYYLPISLVGLLCLLIYLLLNFLEGLPQKLLWFSPLILFLAMINWLIAANTTIIFNSKVHWAPRRAKIAQELVGLAKSRYVLSQPYSIIYVPPSDENRLALNNQDGLRVALQDEKIITVYGYPQLH